MPLVVTRTPPVLYVDPTLGSPSGAGTAADPTTTLALAKAILDHSAIGGTIRVRSTALAPVTGTFTWDSDHDLTIEAWDDDWYTSGKLVIPASHGVVTLDHMHIDVVAGPAVLVGGALGVFGDTGFLVATDCEVATDFDSGWQAEDRWTSVALTRCIGRDTNNDGFAVSGANNLAGVMTLTDCESWGNAQEGASPHDDVVLNIVGGSFHDNGESGMHAINDSICNISGGALFYDNGFLTEDPDTVGGAGVKYRDNASGVINGAEMYGNHFQGVDLDTTGTVTLTSYSSHDNGSADDLI